MDLESLPWYGQFAIFLFIGALLFAGFYFFFYSPRTEEIKTIIAESEQLEAEIRVAERNESKLRKLEEEKMRNEAVLENLKTILPEKKEVEQILRKIVGLAANTRLRVLEFKTQSTRQKEIYEEWPVQMKFEGNYHNLAIFFDQLSRLTKIFNIDVLGITPLQKMSAEYTIGASCTATTYIYHEMEVPKDAAKKKPKNRPAAEDNKNLDSMGV